MFTIWFSGEQPNRSKLDDSSDFFNPLSESVYKEYLGVTNEAAELLPTKQEIAIALEFFRSLSPPARRHLQKLLMSEGKDKFDTCLFVKLKEMMALYVPFQSGCTL